MSPATILICDDAEDMRLLLRTELGFHPELKVVAEATEGSEAVRMAARLQPDVIVLDLIMPGMDGFDAYRRIRDVAPSSQILILSALVGYAMVDRIASLEAAQALPKTIGPSELADTIKAIARRS